MRAHGAGLAALAGALIARPIGWPVVGLTILVACKRRRAAPIVLAVLVLTSALGARAVEQLVSIEAGPVDGWLEVLSDPRPSGPVGVRFDARMGTDRVSVTGHGPISGRLDDLAVGDRVHVRGNQSPARSGDEWARWRHQVGSVSVTEIVDTATGSALWRTTDSLRDTLTAGAESLDDDDRAVFLGMVIGDDRGQSPVVADDFRAAGLGHLLVVSGQNVAFVLAVAAPATVALRPAGRVIVLALVLGLFAAVTRFEPSVLRAVAMAGVGVIGSALGSPVDGRRGLSLAVAGLLMLDPFLAHVLAFQLSAAATGGIVWFSPAIGRRIPGPGWLRIPLATTAAAQAGVAPLLLATFGPMPLAALPANLVAGPVSGPIMVWGSTAGLAAGIAGGPVAGVIHWPTEAMLWWVRSVAQFSASGPQATLDGPSLVVLAGGVVLLGFRSTRLVGVALGVAVVAASLVAAQAPTLGVHDSGAGAVVHVRPESTVVELTDPAWPRALVERLRTMGVSEVDVIVARDGDAADARAVIALRDRFPQAVILAPPLHRVPGARIVRVGEVANIDGVMIVGSADGEEIWLAVVSAAP